ncbi:MAG: nucleotidyltransferase family protein [Candidatus Omnitrophota bacterium]|nr:nucleotidyltransferase family protein [Candidatus Omnitrophota bacterium]
MKALILAAGYAVRLQPLTLNTPKPLLEVGGKKIIDRILAKIAGLNNLDEIYVVTNSKFCQKFVQWSKTCGCKKNISVIDDGTLTNDTRLGAIRDMDLAIKNRKINDDLLVIAGDNLFEVDMDIFMNFASSKGDGVSVALHDVGSLEAAKKYGVVSIDKSGRVVEFEEKPQSPKSTLISTGIYYFPKKQVSGIGKYLKMEGVKNDAPGYYIKWLSANGNVYGFPFSQKWYDIGDIESYKIADEEYKKGENK